MKRLPQRLAIVLIRLYQILAPDFIRQQCRFTPSCCCYGIMAIENMGCRAEFMLLEGGYYNVAHPMAGKITRKFKPFYRNHHITSIA